MSATLSADRLDQLLQQADAYDGAAAAQKHLEYLHALAVHKRQSPKDYQGDVTAQNPAFPQRMINYGGFEMAGNYSPHGRLLIEAMARIHQLVLAARTPEERRQLEQLTVELASGLDRMVAANLYRAAGLYDKALASVDEELAQRQSWELILQKAFLLQIGNGCVASGEYLLGLSQNNIWDDKSQLAHMAAAYFQTAGLYERARQIYEQLAGHVANTPHLKMSLNYYRAECEWRAGNTYQATELLREIVKGCEGRPNWYLHWHSSAAYQPSDLHSLAINLLEQIRILAKVPVRSRDWEPKRDSFPTFPPFAVIPAPSTEIPSAMELELNQLIYDFSFRRTPNVRYALSDSFIEKYGRSAVPALLKALPRNESLITYLLDRVATNQDADSIMESFRHSPALARLAFRLDPQAARVVTVERFPIYYTESWFPLVFDSIIVQYKLREAYPMLLANLAGNGLCSEVEVKYLDRVVTNDPEAETIEAFRQALGIRLERQLVTHQGHQLGKMASIGLKYGVPESIEALLRCQDIPKPKSLALLRPYIDLPADDTAAWQELEVHRGQYRWNAAQRKYELAK